MASRSVSIICELHTSAATVNGKRGCTLHLRPACVHFWRRQCASARRKGTCRCRCRCRVLRPNRYTSLYRCPIVGQIFDIEYSQEFPVSCMQYRLATFPTDFLALGGFLLTLEVTCLLSAMFVLVIGICAGFVSTKRKNRSKYFWRI